MCLSEGRSSLSKERSPVALKDEDLAGAVACPQPLEDLIFIENKIILKMMEHSGSNEQSKA